MNDSSKQIYFTDNDHLNDLAVSLCVDAIRLGQELQLPAEIQNHLQNCVECKNEVLNFFNAYGFVAEEETNNKTKGTAAGGSGNKKNKSKFFFSVAAVFLVAMVLAVIYLWPGNNSADVLSAARFAQNPELEHLIGSTYRSGEVALLRPGLGETVKGPIVFKWRATGIDTFYVKILDNQENLLYEYRTTSFSWHLDKKLSAGLYYWKLESADDLLAVGKFKIE